MKKDQKLSIYDKIFKFFINDSKGCVMAVTDDALFLKAVKGAYKSQGLDYKSFFAKHDLEKAVAEAKMILNRYKQILFFVEASIEGLSNVLIVKNIKSLFGHKCKLIVITDETERNRIIQMYEMGADNVIVKPVSINSLIQKIALTLNPNNNLGKMVDEAKSLIQLGELDQAEKVAEQILKQKPDSSIAFIIKGDIALAKDKFKDAEDHYIRAGSQSRMYLEPLKRLAELFSRTGDQNKRLEYLKKLDKLSPLNYERKIDIGHTYLLLNVEDKARENFDEAVSQVQKQARDMVSATLMRIAKTIGQERPDLGTEYIAKAIEHKGSSLTREDLWMFNEIGISLRQQGKWEQSIDYYKRGLEISPMDGGLYYNMGMAFAQGKQYYKALENFQKAVDSTPDILDQSVSIPYNIAKVCAALNKYQDAGKYLKKALKIDPDFENAKKLLAKIYS
ncbi:tetratricopeptide repeat protein [Desulfonatronovibrio hydrogenovorans]|uniref:tetratricopeptide repeat protein n=1 Tax=Desulfonatronovibrio hydrogenovorans TaxID=53245 RepID=UPI0005518A9C|nr:tetratricopeptide repeat protein [Desulfonatronovibrio hydrogenovorans]